MSRAEKIGKLREEIKQREEEINELSTTVLQPSSISSSSDKIQSDAAFWESLVYKEEKLRLSEEMQEAYAATENDSSYVDWITFTGEVIQPRILTDAGLVANKENLYRLRVAAQKTNVFWVRYNRARQGDLTKGSEIPSGVSLFDVTLGHFSDLRELSLSRPNRLIVLLAGSAS